MFTQISEIFDKLASTKHHTGQVIFLEEDHYVSPDIFWFLKKLTEFKKL